jgi:hypothetical protein
LEQAQAPAANVGTFVLMLFGAAAKVAQLICCAYVPHFWLAASTCGGPPLIWQLATCKHNKQLAAGGGHMYERER